jgi:hypothetical protein
VGIARVESLENGDGATDGTESESEETGE